MFLTFPFPIFLKNNMEAINSNHTVTARLFSKDIKRNIKFGAVILGFMGLPILSTEASKNMATITNNFNMEQINTVNHLKDTLDNNVSNKCDKSFSSTSCTFTAKSSEITNTHSHNSSATPSNEINNTGRFYFSKSLNYIIDQIPDEDFVHIPASDPDSNFSDYYLPVIQLPLPNEDPAGYYQSINEIIARNQGMPDQSF